MAQISINSVKSLCLKKNKPNEEKKESKKSLTQTAFQPIENLFDCRITFERIQNPVVVKCCGHTFEESSLTELHECPLCRATPVRYVRNRDMETIMTESLVAKNILEENEQETTKIITEYKNQNAEIKKSLYESKSENAGLADILQESYKENERLAEAVDEYKNRNAELANALQESDKENDSLFSALDSMQQQMQAAQPKQQKWWQHPVVALTTCFLAGGAVSYLLCWSRALQLAQSPASLTQPTPVNNNTGIINPALLQELSPSPFIPVLPHASSEPFCYSNESSIEDFHTNLLRDKGFTVPADDVPQHSSVVDINPVTAENNVKPIQDTQNTPQHQVGYSNKMSGNQLAQKLLPEIQKLIYKAKRYKSHSYIWDSEQKTWSFPEFTLAERQSLEKNTNDLANAIEQGLIPIIKEDFITGSFLAELTPKEQAETLRKNIRSFLKELEIVSDTPKKSKENTENIHMITSSSSVLPSILTFNNSQPYASFEDDKATTQSILEKLYSKNKRVKCKMDAISETKSFHIQFIQPDLLEKNALDNTHSVKLEPVNMSLSIFRGVKNNVGTQRELLREIEYAFVTNDNFKQKQALDTSPFGKSPHEYQIYRTAVESDLKNVEKYFNFTKANAKLSSDERRKFNRLNTIAKDYEAMSFKNDIVDENFIRYGLAQGSIDKDLRWIVPQEFKKEHNQDSVYTHHFEKKNDKYIRYVSQSPFGVSKVQSLLCDALYILKAVRKKSIIYVSPYAQMFDVYPDLVEILIPAITEHEIHNRHPSYRACLGK